MAAESNVQFLDLDNIDSAEPDVRPQKRRKLKPQQQDGLSQYDKELVQTKKKYDRGDRASVDVRFALFCLTGWSCWGVIRLVMIVFFDTFIPNSFRFSWNLTEGERQKGAQRRAEEREVD
jgi:hypothetical protein